MKWIAACPFLTALKSLYRKKITAAVTVPMTLSVIISVIKQQLSPMKKYKHYPGKTAYW